MTPALILTSRWNPDAEPRAYELRLENAGEHPLADFTLGFSGTAMGVGPDTRIVGGTLAFRLSNNFEVRPPAGFVLQPGERWSFAIAGMPHPLRHWTDGASGAYVVQADGTLSDVSVSPVAADGAPAPRSGTIGFALPAEPTTDLSIVPWPNVVDVAGARPTPAGLDLRPETAGQREAAASFAALVADLFPAEGLVRPAAEAGMGVTFATAEGLGAEAYELAFDDAGASVTASTTTGFLYGLITLGQILRGANRHPGRLIVPAHGRITDEPALGWRGTHFDSARHFFSTVEVSRFLKILAWNKMNRFHWHLSDDEGWRVEIDAFPELTEVGAWRGRGLPIPPLLGGGAHREGGFYTKAAIRELVGLGQSLGIAIVPEIDMPGHCFAVLQSLPDLRDPGETGEYQSVQGFPNNCLNPAHEPVYRFVETVIDEMLDLFLAGIFHLGADEVPLAAWSGSPLALALLERLSGKAAAERHRSRASSVDAHEEADAIEGSDTAVLQAHFIERVHRHLVSRGAVTGGWEEAGHGDVLDKSRSYLVGWRNVEASAALARQGHDIVVSPGQRYYLDMANTPAWQEPGAGWAGSSTPAETYGFDYSEGWSDAERERLLGVQTCIWSERMGVKAVFDRLVFPRLSAVAETGWTRKEHRSWERFRAIAGLLPNMYGNRDSDA